MPKREYARSCKLVSAIVKTAKPMLPLIVIAVLTVSLVSIGIAAEEDFGGCEMCHSDVAENFSTTLHYTGAGMKGEYARHSAEEFGIDMDEYYAKWNCSKCHITTCQKCHVGYEAKMGHGDQTQEMTIDTCDECHKPKQTSTFVGDMAGHKKPGPHADVHYEKGLICTDCHGATELHGDGTYYKSQDDAGAVKVKCEDCHKASDIMAHTIHGDKLDCTACHTGWQLNCKGCHLETRPPYSSVSDEFYLGVGADGKITPFLRMETEYKNETHLAYGAYFTHTITKEAKNCSFCHDNPAVLCEGCEGAIHEEGASFIPQEMIDKILAVEMPTETPAALPTETPAETPAPPGFELIFAVIAIAVVVLLAKRRH
ncbi:hypothetical protein C5S32_02815 [ANME-1 cluster archaeon GoMg1]|nr:hypothetical protein [ANME-1 cluster archaeon GoMg1]